MALIVVPKQIILDEGAEAPPADPVTDGGTDPIARRNAFLELALHLTYGLQDGAVDVLFRVRDHGFIYGPKALLFCGVIFLNWQITDHSPSPSPPHQAQHTTCN